LEDDVVRFLGLDGGKPSVGLGAVGPGHVVAALAAGLELVPLEGGGPRRRAPPLLELARVGPELPGALRRGVELGDDREGQRIGVRARVQNRHVNLLGWRRSLRAASRSALLDAATGARSSPAATSSDG